MRRVDFVLGVVVAVVGACALWMALPLAVITPRSGAPGPGLLPRLLSALLIVLGLLLAVVSVRHSAAAKTEQASSGPDEAPSTRGLLRAGSVWLCYALAVPLLAVLGFVPAAALLVFVLLFGIEQRRDWWAVAAAILIPVATSVVFVGLLKIQLPQGLLGHWAFGI